MKHIDLSLAKIGTIVKLECGETHEILDITHLGVYYAVTYFNIAYRYTKDGKSAVALMNILESISEEEIVEDVHEDLPDSILELGIAAVSEYAYLPKDALRVAFNAMIEEYIKQF